MSNLVGRKPVEVSIKDLRGNAVPQWDAQNKCWKNVVIDSQLAAPFPFHFDFSDVVVDQSKYMKIINDCRIEFALPGEAYCETSPTEDIDFEISYIRSGGNPIKIGDVRFTNGSNFGEYIFTNPDAGLITFNTQTNDVLKVTSPSDLQSAENISITIFGIVTLPVGRADAKFIFNGLDTLTTFSTSFNSSSTIESPVSASQSFTLQALNLGNASDDIIITSLNDKLEFSRNNVDFLSTLPIDHEGDITDPLTIYVRLRLGAFTIGDSYYEEEDISLQNIFNEQDTIRVTHENVTSPGNQVIDYEVTVPAITSSNTLVLKVDTGEGTTFTVNGTTDFASVSSIVKFANVNTPLAINQESITTSISGVTIDFLSPGVYIVDLGTGVNGIGGYASEDSQIIDVLRFGDNKTYRDDVSGFFENCTGITEFTASKREDYPTFDTDTDASDFFKGATNFNDPYINEWDISEIIDLSGFLRDATSFNQRVDKWKFKPTIKAEEDGIFLDSGMNLLNSDLSFIGWGNYARSIDRQFTGNNTLDVGVASTINVRSNYVSYEESIDDGTEGLLELGNRGLTIISSNINPEIRLADNGVTVIAGSADFDQENEINGIVYVVRRAEDINAANAATSVTSKITDMSSLFENESLFGGGQTISIRHWDTSNVTNMSNMFKGADFGEDYNESIAIWDVSKVTNFDSMFQNSEGFNTDLTYWDVSKVSTPSNFSAGSDLENRFVPKWGETYTPLPLAIRQARVAYSLRYVSPAYVGGPVVKVSNGNVDYDLTMYDLLDNDAFNNILGNPIDDKIRIKTLYDQSGNNIEVTEENDSGPILAEFTGTSYELVTEKSKTAMSFGGASEYLITHNQIYASNLLSVVVATTQEDTNTFDHTLLYLANATDDTAYQIVKTKAANGEVSSNSFASIKVSDLFNRIQYSTRGYLGNFLFTSVFKGNFPFKTHIDGVNIEENSTGTYSFTKGNYSRSVIGGVRNNGTIEDGTYFAGKMQEILIYYGDLDDQTINSIESSVNSYYILFDIDQFVDRVTDDNGSIFVANEGEEHHVTVYDGVTGGTILPFVLCPCNAGKEGILYNINPT